MQLDIPTVVMMEVASAALVGLILPSARDAWRVPGFREATLGAWMLAGSFTAQLLRGTLPSVVPMVLGNGLLCVGAALQMVAFAKFDARRVASFWPVQFAVLALSIFALLWLQGVGYAARAIFLSFVIAVLMLHGAWVLVRDGGLARERSRSICIGLCGLTGVCMLVRIAVLLGQHEVDDNPLRPSRERSIAFFPALLYTLGGGLGFLVMHRERSDARSRELALTDPMTGCANRRALEDRVQSELAYAARTGEPVSLLVTDIDRFKTVNDTYGHGVGDAVIRHVATILQRGVRGSDVVARYGGEEFCVLLRDTGSEAAAALADRLRASLGDAKVVAGELELRVTASFGVATWTAGESWEVLFRRADGALYRAKRNGRNRVEVDDPGTPLEPVDRASSIH